MKDPSATTTPTGLARLAFVLLSLSTSSIVRADITCGLAHGYDRGDAAYYYSGDGSLSNFDACSAQCQSSDQCQSFAFGGDQCLLYSAPL